MDGNFTKKKIKKTYLSLTNLDIIIITSTTIPEMKLRNFGGSTLKSRVEMPGSKNKT